MLWMDGWIRQTNALNDSTYPRLYYCSTILIIKRNGFVVFRVRHRVKKSLMRPLR